MKGAWLVAVLFIGALALAAANCRTTRTSVGSSRSASEQPRPPECINGHGRFASYDDAIAYVRRTYDSETADTSRSEWISSAEYFWARGCGYLILGMQGRPYIFAGIPLDVWQGFTSATSHDRFYHQFIRVKYRFGL